MSFLLHCAILLAAASLQLLTVQAQYRRVCYYTNWAQYRPNEGKYYPEDVDPNLCTHIVYAFAKLNGNRLEAFEWNDESTEWMRGMYDRFNDLKMKNRDLKTLLAVGGWNMASKPFTAMVETPASRTEFATTSVRFLREKNFDGLDLDWEYPANRGSPPEDKVKYAQLVTEIRRAFDEEGRRTNRAPLLLTAAVAAGKDKIDTAYDIPSVCRDMDFISIMAYDLHGSWEDVTGHNSPLFPHSGETGNQRYLNMDWASNYWVQQGCPKDKLVIGMGLYGRSFTLKDPYDNGLMAPVRGKGEAGKFTREGGFLSYYEICDMLVTGGQSYYIKEQEAPYAVKGDQWVGYDDVDSLRIKVQWMKQNGFSGVMVWALDLDDFNNHCGLGPYPLMNAINKELLGAIPGPPRSRPNRVQPNPADRPAIAPPVNSWEQPPSSVNQHTASSNTAQGNIPPNMPHLTNEFNCPPNVNSYHANPNSCDEYYICADGYSFKFKCAAPLLWNTTNNFCDWPANVRCDKAVKTEPAQAPRRVPPPTTRKATTTRSTTTATTTTTTTTTPRPPPPPPVQQFDPRNHPIPSQRQHTPGFASWVQQTNPIPTTNQMLQPWGQSDGQSNPRVDTAPNSWGQMIQNTNPTRALFPVPRMTTPTPVPVISNQIDMEFYDWVTVFFRNLYSMSGPHGDIIRAMPPMPPSMQARLFPTQQQRFASQQQKPLLLPPSQHMEVRQFNQLQQNAASPQLFAPPPAAASFCTGKTDGMYPDPDDCTKYVECVQGRDYRGSCSAGTAWDATYGACDYTHKVTRCAIQSFQG